jgi:hypothetical protein
MQDRFKSLFGTPSVVIAAWELIKDSDNNDDIVERYHVSHSMSPYFPQDVRAKQGGSLWFGWLANKAKDFWLIKNKRLSNYKIDLRMRCNQMHKKD